MDKKLLSVEIEDSTMDILEILFRKTNKTKDNIAEKALWILFKEYKEFIVDSV